MDEQSAAEEEGMVDEKNPLFYLRQIPLTEEAMEASNEILAEALYHAALLFKDKVENYSRAEMTFDRLMSKFPDYKTMVIADYNYFILLGRVGRIAEANLIKQRLMENFPERKYAKMLDDPN